MRGPSCLRTAPLPPTLGSHSPLGATPNLQQPRAYRVVSSLQTTRIQGRLHSRYSMGIYVCYTQFVKQPISWNGQFHWSWGTKLHSSLKWGLANLPSSSKFLWTRKKSFTVRSWIHIILFIDLLISNRLLNGERYRNRSSCSHWCLCQMCLHLSQWLMCCWWKRDVSLVFRLLSAFYSPPWPGAMCACRMMSRTAPFVAKYLPLLLVMLPIPPRDVITAIFRMWYSSFTRFCCLRTS